jgi:hypothetical protein
MDRWLKWMVFIGPIVTYLLGVPTGYILAKQEIQSIGARTSLLEGWKDKQIEFNQETVKAIARIKALVKDVP